MLAREDRDELADHAHARQDHDVDGRVRVEPEEVLEQHRVAAQRRVEDADAEHALDDQQQQRDAETGVASTWMMRWRRAPRRTAACGTRSCPAARSLWIVTMKFSPVRIELKPRMNAPNAAGTTAVVGGGAVGRVERPAGVDAARSSAMVSEEQRAEHPQVVADAGSAAGRRRPWRPAERQDEVAERRRDAGDDEQEHHDRAVQREQLVVGVVRR